MEQTESDTTLLDAESKERAHFKGFPLQTTKDLSQLE